MNSTRTEKLGIDKLKAALDACPFLCPYIAENDRTPCWDGNIFVYYSEDWKKKNLKGTVPIQVKTSCQDDLTKNSISFQVDMSDIKAYFNGGGIFFFVIYINADGSKHSIYYASLLPFDLNPIVKIDKASHTFHLDRFPEGNNEEMMNAFALFLDNRPKQMPIITNGLQSFEEMCQKGIEFDSFMFSLPNFGRRNPYDLTFLANSPLYIYAKPKGLNIDIPIQRVSDSIVSMTIPKPIMVNGNVFYPSYNITSHGGKITARIGQSFTLTGLEPEASSQKINFKIKGTLKQRITDLAFFAAILDYGVITIAGKDLAINDFGDAERDFIENTKQFYTDTQRMLDALGVNEDLDCDKITDNDDKNIRNFISAVLYGKHIGFGQVDAQIVRGLFTIANLKLMIVCRRDEQGYYSVDRFTSKLKARFGPHEDWNKGEHVDGPAYLTWQTEHYESACNIDTDDVIQSISEYEATPGYCGIVNQSVLEMLKAYDKQDKKNPQLLTMAEGLCQWLIQHDPEEDKVIAELNHLQVIIRQRALNIAETGSLYRILSDPASTDYCKLGASILLRDYDGARTLLAGLPADETKAEFMNMPIMNLLPKTDEELHP